MTVYLHATLTARPGRLEELATTVERVSRGMTQRGMTLLAAFRTVSADPGGMIDLWRLPGADTIVEALADARAHPAHDRTMDLLARSLADETLQILSPSPGRPVFDPGQTAERRHLQVVHTVRYGSADRFWRQRSPTAEALAASTGWQQAARFDTTVGDLCRLYEIWRSPAGQTDLPTPAALLTPGTADQGVRTTAVTELLPLPWAPGSP